ncbi:MAG TPA: hypothetical protein VMJ32_11815 [Pirellulales bacterium]|nr:hypothetical protein [Pirellulales bacterium]
MAPGDRGIARHEACAVPFRFRDQRLEFCLVSAEGSSRWEFPHATIAEHETAEQAARRCVTDFAELISLPGNSLPLDDLTTTQNGRQVRITVFLLQVDSADVAKDGRRIRWCFAEEARARIRRKPMRRLIDLALRRQTES